MQPSPEPLARRTFLLRAATGAAALACPLRPAAAAAPVPEARGIYRGDADLLARAYGALHPGLYRYNTPAEMAARFEQLQSFLAVPRTLAEAYIALARVTAAVRCGHSYPNFYNQSKAVQGTLFEGRNRLPFHFRWVGDRMIVSRSLLPAGQIAPGSEVVSLGDTSAQQVLQALMPLARADGGNDAKRRRILEISGIDRYEAFDLYLPMLLPQLFADGPVALVVAAPDGTRQRLTVPLMTAAERRALAPSPVDQPRDAVLWTLEHLPGAIARLTMPSWSVYNGTWDWQRWLETALDEIASDGTRHLLVDLRGNEGGLDCGNPILARLVDTDLRISEQGRRVRYRKVPADLDPHVDTWDDSFRDWGEQAVGPQADGFYTLTRWSDDTGQRWIRSTGKRFKGRMTVLVDAVNSSATFQFAQTVKDHSLGRLVGQTTGGNRRGTNGGAFLFLRLPASGLEVDIPLVGYFPSTPQPDAGIEPDVAVIDSRADIAIGADRAMDTALRLLA
jgi:hypothetical protein